MRSFLETAKNYFRRAVTKACGGWLFLNKASELREKDLETKIHLYKKKIFSNESKVTKDRLSYLKGREAMG